MDFLSLTILEESIEPYLVPKVPYPNSGFVVFIGSGESLTPLSQCWNARVQLSLEMDPMLVYHQAGYRQNFMITYSSRDNREFGANSLSLLDTLFNRSSTYFLRANYFPTLCKLFEFRELQR